MARKVKTETEHRKEMIAHIEGFMGKEPFAGMPWDQLPTSAIETIDRMVDMLIQYELNTPDD